jgi:hypothetical protein
MGIITSDEMRDFQFDNALNVTIDRLVNLVRIIAVYNERADGFPVEELDDAGFEAVCSLLNELADVENWSNDLGGSENAPEVLRTLMENLGYETGEILESFGVEELCREGKAAGEFWWRLDDDDRRQFIFGGRRKEYDFGGNRWLEVNEKPPSARAAFVRPRVTVFANVEQFVSVDDAPFLEILCNLLDYWRKNRRSERRTVQIWEGRKQTAQSTDVLIPSLLQAAILKALDGRALKKQALADIVSKGEGSRLYRRGGLKELIQMGKVKHASGRGYYRPDAPPSDAELLAPPK